MKKIKLDHELTPKLLTEINAEIEGLLSQSPLQDKLLLSLITKRDQVVVAHLKQLDANSQTRFAELELASNQVLLDVTKSLHTDSLAELSGLLKGQKAVKKYK